MKGFSNNFVEGIIKRAIKGTLTTKQVAIQLGISRQYVNKLKKKYQSDGKACFTHKNCGKQRFWKTNSYLEQEIIALYKEKYSGFNFTHFLEKLNENEHIVISYGALYRILSTAGIKSPKKHRHKKKEDIHPLRPRKENFGEMLQIDASLHPWFGTDFPKATLHGAIDDSTKIVMGLYFDKEETLNGYYNMFKQILEKYGIPECFYSDNRTIFSYRKIADKDKSIDKDVQTQFKRCCQQLGVDVITTSVAQAKGKIERLWGTLQSRLVSELALNNIKTIDEANAFLPSFTSDFNNRFALEPDLNKSRFVPSPSSDEINYYLSTLYQRTIEIGSCFSFFGKKLQLKDSNEKIVKLPKGAQLDVYLTFDKTVVVVYNCKYYETIEANLSEVQTEKELRKLEIAKRSHHWKPEPYHPWMKFVVNSYRNR